ncbi:MAG: YqeG family HAD IIIA-type phosphatase, partial [Terriglobia bacterium]
MFESLHPDLHIPGVFDLDYDGLRKRGVRGLVIDLDNTLVPRRSNEAPEAIVSWVSALKARGFSAVIVSNNWSNRVKKLADLVDLPLVAPAIKPRRRAFRKALEILGTDAEETAVIGDQIFTDIYGGKRMNLFTILVNPVGNDEMFHTRVLRRIERIILRKLRL